VLSSCWLLLLHSFVTSNWTSLPQRLLQLASFLQTNECLSRYEILDDYTNSTTVAKVTLHRLLCTYPLPSVFKSDRSIVFPARSSSFHLSNHSSRYLCLQLEHESISPRNYALQNWTGCLSPTFCSYNAIPRLSFICLTSFHL
jgi:hypothetical protein